MFRKSLLGFVLAATTAAIVGCAPAPPAAPDTAADEAQLRADALVWFDHFANADGEALGNLYAEDALLMPPATAAVTGRAAIGAFLGAEAATSKEAGISLKPGTVTGVGVSGDIGWVSGAYTVEDASGAVIDSGNYLSVHRRSGGSWPYIRDIWNSDRAPAPSGSGNE